jgi:hypothetical protein
MAIATIISVILGVIGAVDAATASTMGGLRNTLVGIKAKTLAEQMSKDTALMEQMSEAYQRRDTQLLNQIMMSSPFSSRLRALKSQYKQNQQDIANLNSKKVSVASEQAKVNADINNAYNRAQTTGSVIGDLIKGGGSLVKDNLSTNYTGSGYTQQDLKEINYGQKN